MSDRTLEAARAGTRGRLFFIDDIRWLIIVLVVLVHLAVTYTGVGRWYYNEAREPDMVSALLLVFLCSFSQAFFMGLLFFIAGYFVPGPFERKCAGRFVADRLFRLGVPVLVYMLVLDPLTSLVRESFLGRAPADLAAGYARYITSLEVLHGTGPLWFALALLVFSLAFAAVRLLLPGGRARPVAPAGEAGPPLRHRQVALLFAGIAALTFLVRLVQPIGTAVFNMQLANFASYIVLFAAGLWAWRSRLPERLPERLGLAWMRVALFAGIPAWVAVGVFGGAMEDLGVLFGGWHWQAAAYAAWESLTAAGMGMGLIVLFRRRAEARGERGRGRLSVFLSANAFGVYVFHPPIVVLVTMLLRGWEGFVLLKFAAAASLALPACFLASWAVRRLPGLRRLFA